MPNYCKVDMKIMGYKDNVDELLRILQNDDANYPHFCRIFEANEYMSEQFGVCKYIKLSIECAWSAYVCLFPGPFTYYDQITSKPEQFLEGDDWRRNVTNLLIETQRLHLMVQIKSYEPGMCFSEDYILVNGILVKDKESRYEEFYIDESNNFKEFCEEYRHDPEDLPFTEEEFNMAKSNGEYCIPDLEIPYVDQLPFPPKYLYYNLMYQVVDDNERYNKERNNN